MDTTTWEESEKGIYIEYIMAFDNEHISKNAWNACYMPYLSRYMEKDHIYYIHPGSQLIRKYLLESGVNPEKIQDLNLDTSDTDGISDSSFGYENYSLPDGVSIYPPSQVRDRKVRMTRRPHLPQWIDVFCLRAFDDYNAFAKRNALDYHQGKISDEQRLQNLKDFKAKCVNLPDYYYGKINW